MNFSVDAGGTCTAVATWTAPTVTDNCSGASITQIGGPASGSTFPLGSTTIKTWSHGYIPMSKNPMIEGRGMLHYDLLMRDRTGTDPYLRHDEGTSGLAKGHYFLSGTLDENDAELTSAHDFNGDGVLTPGVKWDFLSKGTGEASFGKDGKIDATLSVSWWGHCNDVASAGINFREPKQAVSYDLANGDDTSFVDLDRANGARMAQPVGQRHEHAVG